MQNIEINRSSGLADGTKGSKEKLGTRKEKLKNAVVVEKVDQSHLRRPHS